MSTMAVSIGVVTNGRLDAASHHLHLEWRSGGPISTRLPQQEGAPWLDLSGWQSFSGKGWLVPIFSFEGHEANRYRVRRENRISTTFC